MTRWHQAGLLVGLQVLGGCAQSITENVFLELEKSDFIYFVFLSLDASRQPRRVIDQGSALPVQFSLEADDESLLAIGMTSDFIRRDAIDFSPDRVSEIRLNLESTCPPGFVPQDGRSRLIPVRADAAFFHADLPVDAALQPADPAEFPAILQATLSIPIEPEGCRHSGDLAPFGQEETFFPVDTPLAGQPRGGHVEWFQFRQVTRVSDQKVIAVSQRAAYLLDRHQPFMDHPDRVVLLEPDSIHGEILAVDRRAGFPMLAALTGRANTTANDFGLIWDLLVHEDRLELIGTSTTTPFVLWDLRFDDLGRLIAVGDDEVILTRSSSSAPFVRGASQGARNRRIRPTGEPVQPHVLATFDGSVLLGDAFSGQWDEIRENDFLLSPRVRGLGTRKTADGSLDKWIVGSGLIYRSTGGADFELVEPKLPPRLANCRGKPDGCLLPAIAGVPWDIAVFPDISDHDARLLTVSNRCSAVIAIRPSDGCATAISFGSGPIDSTGDLYALDVFDGWLTVGGGGSRLYEFSFR